MNITYDTIRGSRIVTAKDQGALILRTGTVYDGIGRRKDRAGRAARQL